MHLHLDELYVLIEVLTQARGSATSLAESEVLSGK